MINEFVEVKPVIEKPDVNKSEFLSNMSCEVQSLLNSILILAHLILKSEDVDSKIRNDVKMMVECGDTLFTLFNNMMDTISRDDMV